MNPITFPNGTVLSSIRAVCPKCKVAMPIGEDEIKIAQWPSTVASISFVMECPQCHEHFGFEGRIRQADDSLQIEDRNRGRIYKPRRTLWNWILFKLGRRDRYHLRAK